MTSVTAVAAALGAAMIYGSGAVLQYRSAKQVPSRGPLEVHGLLADLSRRPLWLAAIVANFAGLVLQIVALRYGPLALVQPLLVSNLVFAALISAFTLRRRPPDWIILVGVVCCAAGLSGFLATARPHGGGAIITLKDVLPLAVVLAAVLVGCLAVARVASAHIRPLALALACGVTYGVTAFLLKLVTESLSAGLIEPLEQWPLYAAIVLGVVGFLLSQSAFHVGVLVSPVLAVITVTDPLVSIGIAHLWLNESVASSAGAIAVEVVSLAVMAGGIIALAYRAPLAAKGPAFG